MILDSKALEAAGIQLKHACGRIEQIFAQRETPPPEKWAAMYVREVQPILEAAFIAADLVPRKILVECRRELQTAWDERDEAHRERDIATKDFHALFDEATKIKAQLVAMRRVLEGVKQSCLFTEDNGQIGVTTDPHIDDQMFSDICTIFNNTAKVAEQYQLVDDEHVVVPIEPTLERLGRGLEHIAPAFRERDIEIRREIYRITTAPTKPESEGGR